MFALSDALTPFTAADFVACPTNAKLVADSRDVQPGDIFVAYRGQNSDARHYITDALKRGAAFVFWEDDGQFFWDSSFNVPNRGVQQLSVRVGLLAAAYYGDVLRQNSVYVVGVTGTNGKTSISQWLAEAYDLLQKKCAVLGTAGNGYLRHLTPSTHTTLEALMLQHLLKTFANDKVDAIAMEVSSHGLAQHRVVGVPFSGAVFSNLTRDHLDYHGSMQAYAKEKARLFEWQGLRHALINVDDEFGRELAAKLRRDRVETAVFGYGLSAHADVRIVQLETSMQGLVFQLETPWGLAMIKSGLIGRFNAYNLAACLGILCAQGFEITEVVRVLAKIKPAQGRMDCVRVAGSPLVVIDYAHTPDALEKALSSLKELLPAGGALWCVFGCGGNRDVGKRPLMGQVAAKLADNVVLTSDNPRFEAPEAIIRDILAAPLLPYKVELDRKKAISDTVQVASERDIVLVAGKGHESYQEIAGVRHDLSDSDVVESVLQTRGRGGA